MSTKNTESADNGQAAALSSAAIARRRILLKGVGKGAAVLAATVPIQTLAGQSLLTFDGTHACVVSGIGSGVHSTTPGNTQRCAGFNITYWRTLKQTDWPTGTYGKLWKDVFVSISPYSSDSLSKIVKNSTTPAEAHWVVAWLNATRPHPSYPFPYLPDQVRDFNTANSTDAFTFFRDFMENPI